MRSLLTICILFASLGTTAAIIRINNVSNMDFGSAAPGDPSKTVPPGTSENSVNGSFSITGNNNTAYTITVPSSPITMNFGSGPTGDTISVSSFQSFPSPTGRLSASGSQTLFIGATRAALRANQKAGSYSGSYSITVVY